LITLRLFLVAHHLELPERPLCAPAQYKPSARFST
jgi:hypothetical protein